MGVNVIDLDSTLAEIAGRHNIVVISKDGAEIDAIRDRFDGRYNVLSYGTPEEALAELKETANQQGVLKPQIVVLASEAVGDESAVKALTDTLKKERLINRGARILVTFAKVDKQSESLGRSASEANEAEYRAKLATLPPGQTLQRVTPQGLPESTDFGDGLDRQPLTEQEREGITARFTQIQTAKGKQVTNDGLRAVMAREEKHKVLRQIGVHDAFLAGDEESLLRSIAAGLGQRKT